MANSHTRKNKHSVTLDEVKKVTDAAGKYVASWTVKEVNRLKNKTPIIVETAKGYLVGKYSVDLLGHSWEVKNSWGELQGLFTSKRSAVTWCLLQETGRINSGKRLLTEDRRVNKLSQEATYYAFRKQRAIKTGDYFKADLCESRLSNIRFDLDYAKNELQKTLELAKYLKGIWE